MAKKLKEETQKLKNKTKSKTQTSKTKKTSIKKAIKKSASKSTTKQVKGKSKTKNSASSQDKELLQTIVEGMQEKKANSISILDLQAIENNFCNYFIICEAESKPQLQAIADSVQEFTQKKLGIKPHHIEGLENAEWILIDYLTIVVHIFRSDVRRYYKIEELWADAKIQSV